MWIGVSGKMGSGKDYFVENYIKPYIENQLKEKCLIISFADMLKFNLIVHHNILLDQFNNKTPEIRSLLQLEGTEKGRNIHGEDIWIRYVKAWGELHMSRGIKYIIISDVRFKNEYEFIKKNGGLIFRMFSPNRNEIRLRKESKNEEMYEQIKNHQSEIELDDFKFDIIVNNIDKIDSMLEFV
jgi:hypothetical protein